jgi:hypothetical protein
MPTDPRPDLASAMWPQLSQSAKAKEAQQAREDAWRKRNRDHLVKCLREATAAVRADKARSER